MCFDFTFQYVFLASWSFFRNHGIFRNMLFNFQICMEFSDVFLFWIFTLIQSWSENTLYAISVSLGSLRFILRFSTWSVSVEEDITVLNVKCAPPIHLFSSPTPSNRWYFYCLHSLTFLPLYFWKIMEQIIEHLWCSRHHSSCWEH